MSFGEDKGGPVDAASVGNSALLTSLLMQPGCAERLSLLPLLLLLASNSNCRIVEGQEELGLLLKLMLDAPTDQ